MASKTKLTIEGDVSNLQKAFRKMQRELIDTKAKLKQTGQEGVKQNKLLEKTIRETETAQERYNRKLKTLAPLLQQGKQGQEAYARGAAKAKQELRGQNAEGGKLKGMLSTVKQLGPAFGIGGGLAGAVAVATSALREMREESAAGLTSMRALVDQRVRLNQVSTSLQDLQNLSNLSDTRAIKFGVGRGVVRRVQFAARSEGFEKAVDPILRANQVVSPESAASAAGQVPALFPGSNLTPLQSINLLLRGAQDSRVDFEKLAGALPTAASGAALTGATPSGTVASLSVLASRFKSELTAADRIKALGTKLFLDPRTKGKGLVGGVEALQDLTPEARKKFLGESQELNVAFTVMVEELDRIKALRQKLLQERQLTGTPQSALNQGIARANADPNFRAQKQIQIAEIRREVFREQRFATREAGTQAAVLDVQSSLDVAGASGFAKFVGGKFAEGAQFAGAGPGVVSAAGQVGGFTGSVAPKAAFIGAQGPSGAVNELLSQAVGFLAEIVRGQDTLVGQQPVVLEDTTK